MSKRTSAGLGALAVWATNKALALYGLPHLAPSLVWAFSVVLVGAAATLTTSPATSGHKATQWLVALLAMLGAVGVQLVDTRQIEPLPVPVEAPASAPSSPAPLPAAPAAFEAPPVVDLDATPLPPGGTSDDAAHGLE
jgi:hypothetical protein